MIQVSNQKENWSQERINGWAPGWYTCTCKSCDMYFMGDKRASLCYPCAKDAEENQGENTFGDGI